ncbi:MAG: holo-ACP synthase, partial [Eggerthellaceae bacterium]|nr:holo-ACP synthase [Eggerthellaceae bacterium]
MPRSKKTQQAIDEALRIDPDKPPVGLGVDIVEIDRIRKILKRSPAFKNIFSENERKYCDSMTDPAPHYACRFAAKEAVVKALGCG